MSSSKIVGAESTLNDIWSSLMDENLRIIALVGVGGVGKTTLLKQTFNKLSLTPHQFDPVIWVTVSGDPSIEKLQDDIWKTIGVFDSNWVQKSFHQKSQTLAQFLSQKKFLLILDDVLEAFKLSDIGVPTIEPGAEINEFKVILTSRAVYVCQSLGAQAIIKVNHLGEEAAWELFKQKLWEDKLVETEIIHVAMLIARLCKGLPLLLCTVARAMASKRRYAEWEACLKQLKAAPKRHFERISHLLAFCFDSLPNDMIRSCISYFSLFPEDFSIPKNELIDFWIVEQLLGDRFPVFVIPKNELIDFWIVEQLLGDRFPGFVERIATVRNRGHALVELLGTELDFLDLGYNAQDTLIGASLLLEEPGDNVKLQDLVRDFALSMAFKSQIMQHAQLIEVVDDKALDTVGWVVPMRGFLQYVASVPHNLLTFLLNHNPFIVIKGGFSQFMDALTVLDLSNSGVEVVPPEISNLASLQYLNLSHTWIDRLPIQLKMLTKLKCLNLEHNCHLRVVPKKLVLSLSSLQILKIFRCGFSVEEVDDNILSLRNMDIDPLLCLKHLQVLSITVTCSSALEKYFCRPKLTSCTQSLSLEVFWGTEYLDISPLAAMKNLLLLEIHQAEKLQKLSFNIHYPELLRAKSFERLKQVTLESCSSLQELTWVVVARNLSILRVKSCAEMKEIISIAELSDNSLEPFSKLEILQLENLPELKSIYRKVLPLRCLKKIKIAECSLLRELPLNLDGAKRNEMVIEAEEDWWGNVEWKDDATKTAFLPFFRPLNMDS